MKLHSTLEHEDTHLVPKTFLAVPVRNISTIEGWKTILKEAAPKNQAGLEIEENLDSSWQRWACIWTRDESLLELG